MEANKWNEVEGNDIVIDTYRIKSSWEDVKSHPLTDGSEYCRTWVRD